MSWATKPGAGSRVNRGSPSLEVATWAVLLCVIASTGAYGAPPSIERLAGSYVGERVSDVATGPMPAPTDLHLDVRARGEGFVLRWQSLDESADEATRHHEIAFVNTRRPGIYLAGMRCSAFGQPRPLDPGRGEPYVWAYLAGDELSVYLMSISDDGSHVLSRYRYRLDGDRLTLAFERSRGSRMAQRIDATLKRATVEASRGERTVQRHAGANCG